ncbi:MAG TPA: hypothetical protein VMC80_01715 [Patescibacteria group bacterium]|nr:hypothetical protein [Patescibacteria group bacterium]
MGLDYTLFVDDDHPADKKTLELFQSRIPDGLVMLTSGSLPHLRYKDEKENFQDIKGNREIRQYIITTFPV